MVQQAVRQKLYFDFRHYRREPAKGLDETGIAVYLHIQAPDYPVVRLPVLAEILIGRCNLVQGIGQVEGHILFLRIEENGQLVGRRDDIHHALMLAVIILLELGLFFRALGIDHLQFGTEVLKNIAQCLSVHHRKERNGENQDGENNRQEFLLHNEISLLQCVKIRIFALIHPLRCCISL